jgi:hypothetical protein
LPFSWRRVLAAGAASVGLHVALWDVGADAPRPLPAASRVPVVAELRTAPAAAAAPPAAETGAALPLPQVQLPGPRPARPRAGPLLPRYKVSLPPPAQLVFDAVRTGTDGVQAHGQALIDWRHAEGKYALVASLDVPGSSLLAWASEGSTGSAGLAPRTMSAQRRGKARTATHFNARQGRITFSASEQSVAMAPGTQDRATVPLQLAGIARAAGKLGTVLTLMVGEEKGASVMRFTVVGQEEIDTGIGRLATWRLSYVPDPATYRSSLDVWLAPQQQWYPVQLRSTEANGAITTQTIRAIVVDESGN